MDFRNKEVSVVEKNPFDVTENSLPSLADYQLALIGGGVGEIVVG